MKKKVALHNLGCKVNAYEVEAMQQLLENAGYETVPFEEGADVYVINTCTVTNIADRKSRQMLHKAKKMNPDAIVVATGCYAQADTEKLKEDTAVDLILGNNQKTQIVEALEEYEKEHAKQVQVIEINHTKEYEELSISSTAEHVRAYIKVQDGCNQFCTYCIIPYIRGNYRSVPMEDLIGQAKELVANGAKELILVAQETTLYGIDLYGEKSLHKLLDELNKINGLFWIRIMYCYPEEIYEDLIDSMIRNEKVCHYLDIPIQHSNDTMLKRMGRRTSHDDLVRIITHLRERIPDITLRTTLICGFPGETQEIHEELMQFINDMEFDRLGAFTYSPEEGTPAAEFTNQVDENLKKDWQADVMELQEEIIFDKNETMKGRELYVFIEGKVSDENAYVGRTYRDAPDVDGYIFINTDEELMTGDIAKVRVTGAYEYDLIGELI